VITPLYSTDFIICLFSGYWLIWFQASTIFCLSSLKMGLASAAFRHSISLSQVRLSSDDQGLRDHSR
jgi:hypothetical protein